MSSLPIALCDDEVAVDCLGGRAIDMFVLADKVGPRRRRSQDSNRRPRRRPVLGPRSFGGCRPMVRVEPLTGDRGNLPERGSWTG